MRTNLLPKPAATLLWLERDVTGSAPERIELASLPFTLGRNEACDYQIRSSRVSREHAEISREAGLLQIRDLGSTNGTFVNGKRIDQQRLVDGDLIVIADCSFSVRSNRAGAVRKTVTQVMDCRPSEPGGEEDEARQLIHAVRRQQEILLHRAARSRFQPIYDLAENCCIGYEALARHQTGQEASPVEQSLEAIDCRLTERMSQLHRLMAAEHFATVADADVLFVKLQPAEVGADFVPRSLSRLAALTGNKHVVAEIPDTAVVDIPYFRDFRNSLRERNIGVAYGGFSGSQTQLRAWSEFPPDFVKLAPALARGVDKSTQRQQQIKSLVEATLQTGVQLIVAGVHTENEARTCRDLGCRLAQGDHFGRAQTIDWPVACGQCA